MSKRWKMKKIIPFLFGLFYLAAPGPALTQSGCSSIVSGAVLTAAQWQNCFQLKSDFLGAPPVLSVVGTAPISAISAAGVTTISIAACSTDGQVLYFTASAWACSASPSLSTLILNGSVSGAATITPQATAGTPTLTIGTTTGTIASSATAPLAISATTGVVSITGAAGQVLAGAGPAFTATPSLGAAGGGGTLTLVGSTSGSATISVTATAGTLNLATGATVDASGNITSTTLISSGSVTGTSILSPLHVGGSAAGSTLTLKSTSGTGTSDAIIFQVGSNGATEGFRVATGGQIVVGGTSAQTYASITPAIQLNTLASQTVLAQARWSNDNLGSAISLLKSRGTSVGSYTIVQSGDNIGNIFFRAATGAAADVAIAATIVAEVDGTPGATNDMPGRLIFQTTPDGSSASAERLRISNNGHTRWSGTAPGLSACGTSPAISGNDMHGTVTMGTAAPAGCVITFALVYATAPTCRVTWRTNIASMQYTVSTTAITLTQTATSSNLIDYDCWGA